MQVTGGTSLFAILGDPVGHSLSPAMQNAALQAAGIDGVYVPWRVRAAGLRAAFEALRAMENFGGANVTLPHKEQAVGLVDELSPEAAAVGAVNTLVRRNGRLLGANTDPKGFLRALEDDAGFSPRGRKAVIVGAGGAARAVAWGLAEAGIAELVILNRTVTRAASVAEVARRAGEGRVSALGIGDPRAPEAVAEAALLVNATSVGLRPSDPSPVEARLLAPGMLVYDLVYHPAETALLREARGRGCQALGGLGMLLHQGALAFELWTGRKPALEVMRAALIRALA